MSVIVTGPTEKEVKDQIKAMRTASARINASKASAREYLYKHGFITKSGKLTKRYGG